MTNDRRLTWRRNPALRATAFDNGSGNQSLLELDDASGHTQRLLVSTPLATALDEFVEPSSIEDALTALRKKGWSDAGLERLEASLRDDCASKNLLIADDASTFAAPTQRRRPHYLSLMIPVLPARLVNSLAPVLAVLFSTRGLLAGVGAVIAGQIALMHALLTPTQTADFTSGGVLVTVGLGLSIVLLHELGHAAAAWRGGARRVSIGVGWYVCFPVAYADLSEIWRLSRRQRALIDVAGVYLQGIAVAALMLVHLYWPSSVLLAVSVAATLSIFWNMNPLLRMDGYWFLSDLLGTPTLRADALAALRCHWRRWRRLPAEPLQQEFSPRVALFISAYAAASALFLFILLVMAAIHFGNGVLVQIPQYARHLLAVDLGDLGAADLIVLLGSIIWKSVLLVMLGRYLLRLCHGLLKRGIAWLPIRRRVVPSADQVNDGMPVRVNAEPRGTVQSTP